MDSRAGEILATIALGAIAKFFFGVIADLCLDWSRQHSVNIHLNSYRDKEKTTEHDSLDLRRKGFLHRKQDGIYGHWFILASATILLGSTIKNMFYVETVGELGALFSLATVAYIAAFLIIIKHMSERCYSNIIPSDTDPKDMEFAEMRFADTKMAKKINTIGMYSITFVIILTHYIQFPPKWLP